MERPNLRQRVKNFEQDVMREIEGEPKDVEAYIPTLIRAVEFPASGPNAPASPFPHFLPTLCHLKAL